MTSEVPIPSDTGADRDSVSSQVRVLVERNHQPFELPHGQAPAAAIERARSRLAAGPQGPVWELVLSAREGQGDVPLVMVEPDPVSSLAPEAWGAVSPTPRVRPGSYALLVRRRPAGDEVLLTKLSGEHGAWTLPGGGLDPGEAPEAGAGREVHEETGLEFHAEALLGVVSTRFIGHAATGRLEDFQLLGLVYTGRVDEESAPRVVEVGGSTSDARWVPTRELGETFLTPLALTALELWGPPEVSAEPVPGPDAAHLAALEAVRQQVGSTRHAASAYGPAPDGLAPDGGVLESAGVPAPDDTAAPNVNRWRDAAVLAALDAAVLAGRHATVDALADSYGGLLAYEPGVSPSGAVVLRPTAGAERRHRGAFATPRRLADAVARRGIPTDLLGHPNPGRRSRSGTAVTVVDPACGTGALLRAALRRLVGLGVPPIEAATCLHGVELDPIAIEVCRAALLADLERLGVDDAQCQEMRRRLTAQIVSGEALLGAASRSTRSVDAEGNTREVDAVSATPAGSVVWHEVFAGVLDVPGQPPDPVTGWRGGFEVVLANPPWERLKVSRRDWAGAPPSGLRDERVRLSAALRRQGRHPLTGHGELNAYLLFVETCWRLLAAEGRACLVVPAGIATDRSAAHLLGSLVERGALERLDILAAEVAAFGGVSARVGVALVGLRAGPAAEADPTAAARLATDVTWDQLETDAVPQQWSLDAPTLRLVSPNTGSPPPCASPADAALVVAAHRTWDVLVRRGRRAPDERPPPSTEPLGPWQVRLITPLHMTRDAKWFRPAPGEGLLPVWEAKHAGLLDPCGGSAVTRYWVPRDLVEQRFGSLTGRGWLAGYRNVTTSDAPRTLLPTPLPVAGVGNSLPLIDAPRLPLLLACLASLPLDYLARQKHVGANLNFFKLEQLPVPDPTAYDGPAPWDGSVTLESWVLDRLRAAIVWDGADLGALRLELCRELGVERADDAESAAPDLRPRALAELDAAHAVLLGWRREELEHAIGTFSALRWRDERLFGSFVTRERILAAFDRLAD